MPHRPEIAFIMTQVKPWPMEDKVALAYEILREFRKKTREPDPRQTLDRALGIAAGTTPPPDDATVDAWLAEHRTEKHT